jgi:hypothetical protein
LSGLLRAFNIKAEGKVLSGGLISFEARKDMFINMPNLPESYAFIGGTARCILLSALGIVNKDPRDYDIVYTGKIEDFDQQEADKIARIHMMDDASNGYGIKPLGENYFTTRDFTINECVATKEGGIICTLQCLLDTLRNIVRLTKYEHKQGFNVSEKLMFKAVRLVAESIRRGYNAELDPSILVEIKNVNFSTFWIALQLERSF